MYGVLWAEAWSLEGIEGGVLCAGEEDGWFEGAGVGGKELE